MCGTCTKTDELALFRIILYLNQSFWYGKKIEWLFRTGVTILLLVGIIMWACRNELPVDGLLTYG